MSEEPPRYSGPSVHLEDKDYKEARRFSHGLTSVVSQLEGGTEPDWEYFCDWSAECAKQAQERLLVEPFKMFALRVGCWTEFLMRCSYRETDPTNWLALYDNAVGCFPALWVLDLEGRTGADRPSAEIMAALHFAEVLSKNIYRAA
jgi:hypothetical protein